jgi:predicted amidophosphoribosyltransferase
MNLLLSTLEFGSLLTYSPSGNSEAEKRSKTAMRNLKNDQYLSNPPILMSNFISALIKEKITKLPFADFFKNNPILVPIPNSSLMTSETLWVPKRLADALIRNGLGKTTEECLKRTNPLPKAATSLARNRPTAAQHYHSIEVQTTLSDPIEFLLIDVVTRGATMIGAANKLLDAFPRASIRAFAAMRTMSPPYIFAKTIDPCKGVITFVDEEAFRRP